MPNFSYIQLRAGEFTRGFISERKSLRSHPQGPLEDTPDPSPTVSEGISFFVGLGEVWGIFPGYVGKIIENLNHANLTPQKTGIIRVLPEILFFTTLPIENPEDPWYVNPYVGIMRV